MTGFKKAVKYEQKFRLALCGPTGSGKTYTALMLAQEIAGPDGKVALLDTEHGSASLYADEFAFDTLELTSFAPKRYVEGIRQAAEAGYDVLVIDSLSHAWMGIDGALDQVDKAKARGGGNQFTAWRDVTPQHNQLVDAIVGAPMHIIATMRSKMEYAMEEVDDGGRKKTVVRKLGMAPVQRDGMEYEFTVVGDMDQAHTLVISKSRIRPLADQVIVRPDRDVARTIMGWLAGETAPEKEAEPEAVPEASTNGQASADLDKRPSTKAQQTFAHKLITDIWGKDERAAYDWIKERQPRACGDTEVHTSPLSMAEASALIEMLNKEKTRRSHATPAAPKQEELV